ncbi:P-type conjugative transfer protein TrbL [Pseudomonas aeruginosa]|jgi:type IV secretion system protein VirB6/type IV secretion system protein TrbL|uniref:P-type conjugative transfer protein TrbL n=1 Tax=Pseudomonas aeruginosa TaxID=287 RepID=UPI00093A92C1|nr:P-type conjugative transfer protein TrbL [Pseudomonas aeruginosa]MBO9333194.1 P-type conjugative transfer protein TrbL [Achromobacter xylosoxidans]NUQ51624.1 P-type conjugative transfer protein TrbL [Phycisphaerales bacterium]
MRYLLLRLAVLLSVLLVSQTASAAIDQSGVLDEVADRFMTQSATWGTTITTYATWLFWTLVVISMVWTFGMMALRKADIGEFFAELVRFTIFTGFFWWLLENGPSFAMDIVNSLRDIGAAAGGVTRTLTPSTPLDIAFDIIVKAGKSYSILHPIDNLAIFLTTLAILACMAVVAANVLLALVTAWVMAYAGIFVLGFGGARWTSDIAINYFRAVAGIALKLMTMTLLIGVAVAVMDGFHADLQEGAPMRELLVIFVVALVLVVLIHSIPNVIAGLIPGGGQAASSGSSFSAGAIAGAAVGAGAAVASGGAALAAGGAAATGGAQALMAAVRAGQANVSAGTDSVSSLMSAFRGAGESAGSFSDAAGFGGGSGSSGGSAGTSTPLAQAAGFGGSGAGSSSKGGGQSQAKSAQDGGNKASAGTSKTQQSSTGASSGDGAGGFLASAAKAGKVAVEAGSILAQHAASSIGDAAQERIGQTSGGKLAAAIRASSQKEQVAEDVPTFGDNSLAAADSDDEVAAFANRDRNSDKEV